MNIPSEELEVLREIEEIVGEPISVDEKWEDSPRYIVENNHIVNLNLAGLEKITIVPESIANLSYLEKLDLSGYELFEEFFSIGIASLPKGITKLRNLKMLRIGYSQIEEFPEMVTTLNNLVLLSLRHTRITSIPESITKLQNLKSLDLSECWKLTSLPESLAKLQNLTSLSLRGAGITSLPENIGDLKNLSFLGLGRTKWAICKITSLPKSIGRLKSLKNLDLCYCNISSLPESFDSLKNLEDLDLWYAKLSELPETIAQLKNLKNLRLTPELAKTNESVLKILKNNGCNLQIYS